MTSSWKESLWMKSQTATLCSKGESILHPAKGERKKRKTKKLPGTDREQQSFSMNLKSKQTKHKSKCLCTDVQLGVGFCPKIDNFRYNSLAVPENHFYENFLVWLLLFGFFSIEIIDVLSYRNLYNKIIFQYKNKLS